MPALLALLLTGCASHINAPEAPATLRQTGFDTRTDVTFSPEHWPEALQADLYLADTEQPAPAVLVIHGGGWERRSREDMNRISRQLASRGFSVMNMDYRFAPEHRFPAQLHDAQLALQWLRQHAAELSINPEQISVLGFSSGAHLATMLAVAADPRHPHSEPFGGPGTRVSAVVAGGLPADLRIFGSGRLLRQLLGGTQQEYPQRYRDASPVTAVSAGLPPHFLFHGTWDRLVPIGQSEAFHEALLASGVHSELYRMRFRGHLTSFLTSGGAITEAIGFLERLGTPTPDSESDTAD